MCNVCDRMVEENFQIEVPFDLVNKLMLPSNNLWDLENNPDISDQELEDARDEHFIFMCLFSEKLLQIASDQVTVKMFSYELDNNENSNS